MFDIAEDHFVGEAEDTWPQFLEDWEAGTHHARYEQQERTDMTRVPVPRYDLLKMQHYLIGSVQFSRGCPFNSKNTVRVPSECGSPIVRNLITSDLPASSSTMISSPFCMP